MKKKLLLGLLSMTLLLSACSEKSSQKADDLLDNNKVNVEEKSNKNWLSSFNTMNLEGDRISEEIFKDNKLTMVNAWSSWCGPCLAEIPYLGQLDQEYRDRGFAIKGLILEQQGNKLKLGITEDEKELVELILRDNRAEYEQILVSEDIEEEASKIMEIPSTFFVDSDGNFVGKVVKGARSKEDWKKIIEERLDMVEDGKN